MFDYPVVFVDIETTGGSYRYSRVLEVAAIRYENGLETQRYCTLVNPGSSVPSNITAITGITTDDIAGAPTFEDIADELYEVLEGAVFIAHNVRFDYSFLKHEFMQIGMTFQPKLLCTVRLSRALYNHEKGHSLAKLIDRHKIQVGARHRAMADAHAIKQFAELAYREHGSDIFASAVDKQLRSQSLPPHLETSELENIDNVPGVYILKDEHHQPVYIGKSINLRKRILSHFQDTSPKEIKISQQVHHIETIPTGSELAALVMESRLVKQLKPVFNRQLRRVSRYALLMRELKDDYATVGITQGEITADTNFSNVYGLYETRTKARRRIEELTRTFELCPRLMGYEKRKGACFSYSLGRCKGACIGKEAPDQYNRRFEVALENTRLSEWPYDDAIVLQLSETGEHVIIDNWIVRGFMSSEGVPILDDIEPQFDVDEYKILRRFIRDNASRLQLYPTDNHSLNWYHRTDEKTVATGVNNA